MEFAYNAAPLIAIDPADLSLAAALLPGRTRLLARGATCTVYTNGVQVVRLSDPNPGKTARFRVDAQVRRKLREQGIPTPETHQLGQLPGGRAFSLEGLVKGDDIPPSPRGWQQLSEAIQALHRLDFTGYGLLEDREDLLNGSQSDAEDGFRSRLEQAWPFHPGSVTSRPLIWLDKELREPIQALEEELRALANLPVCVCHTDLHLNQWVWRNAELAAFLDFGDASIGPPEWDWASLAYFHGWDSAARLANQELTREVALFGLLLAFHRASRAVSLNRPHRKAEAVQFARSCLERLSTPGA